MNLFFSFLFQLSFFRWFPIEASSIPPNFLSPSFFTFLSLYFFLPFIYSLFDTSLFFLSSVSFSFSFSTLCFFLFFFVLFSFLVYLSSDLFLFYSFFLHFFQPIFDGFSRATAIELFANLR